MGRGAESELSCCSMSWKMRLLLRLVFLERVGDWEVGVRGRGVEWCRVPPLGKCGGHGEGGRSAGERREGVEVTVVVL